MPAGKHDPAADLELVFSHVQEARKTNRARWEEPSEQPTSFGKVEQFISCQVLHKLFNTLI